MARLEQLPQGVMIGYGDTLNAAFEVDEAGELIWHRLPSEDGVATSDPSHAMPTMYMAINIPPKSVNDPAAIHMGPVFSVRDTHGMIQKRINPNTVASTERPIAVRILATLSALAVRKLAIGDPSSGSPEDRAIRDAVVNAMFPPDQKRLPVFRAIRADLSLARNPSLYLP